MIVTIVRVSVKPDHVDEFIQASIANHEGSVQEKGNKRFDILQSDDDPTSFILYEAYESGAEATAHKETAHYQKWRDTVAYWMAEPRQGTKYTALRP